MNPSSDSPILFYDGDCGICSRSVRTLAHLDRKDPKLYYAPLQGRLARELLPAELHENLSTAVLYTQTMDTNKPQIHTRSDAILQAVIATGSYWRIPAKIIAGLPVSWRNAGYDWIAEHRHRFYGAKSCPLESPIPKDRLLD